MHATHMTGILAVQARTGQAPKVESDTLSLSTHHILYDQSQQSKKTERKYKFWIQLCDAAIFDIENDIFFIDLCKGGTYNDIDMGHIDGNTSSS